MFEKHKCLISITYSNCFYMCMIIPAIQTHMFILFYCVKLCYSGLIILCSRIVWFHIRSKNIKPFVNILTTIVQGFSKAHDDFM